jgi:hypothetical protein
MRAGTVVAANRDSLSFTPAAAMNTDEGTVFLRFKITGNPDVGGFARLLRIANSGGTTFLEIRQGSAVGSNLIVTGNGGSTFLTAFPIADWRDGREYACVLGYTQIPAGDATKRVYFGYNGGPVVNSESTVVGPADSVTPEVLHFGPSVSASRFPVAIMECQYFDRLLPLEEMHRLIGYNTERTVTGEAWPDLWPDDPPWVDYLIREALGLSSAGVTNSPDVLEVYRQGWTVFNRVATSTTVDFCAFGLSWMFEKFGIRGTGDIKGYSSLPWGREVALDAIPVGSVVMVTNRDADDPDFSGINHVALFLGLDPNDPTQFWMGGFNQNSRRTSVQLRPVSQILAARWPTQRELVNG